MMDNTYGPRELKASLKIVVGITSSGLEEEPILDTVSVNFTSEIWLNSLKSGKIVGQSTVDVVWGVIVFLISVILSKKNAKNESQSCFE